MKLVVLKLLSLFVLLAGILALGVAVNLPQLAEPLAQAQAFFVGEAGFHWKLLVLGAILTMLGGYAFLPQLGGSRRTISYTGEHGEINIQIDKAEATLRKLILGMPEVKSVKVRVHPDKTRKRASIKADAVIINQDDAPARHTYELITALIRETATDVLGLEIDEPIQLQVTGTKVNPRAASEALHARVKEQRKAEAGGWVAAAATASAIPAAASILPEVPVRSENDYTETAPVLEDDYTAPAVEPLEMGEDALTTTAAEDYTDTPEVEIELEAADGSDGEDSALEALEDTPLPAPEVSVDDPEVTLTMEESPIVEKDEDFRLPPLSDADDEIPAAQEPEAEASGEEPNKDQWS